MAKAAASIGRNAGYNLGGALIPLLLALVTVPLYLELIGPDRYGVLAIAWLLLGYFGLFDLGLGRATSYRIAALRDAPAQHRATTLWSAIAVNLAMGLAGGVVLWIAADWFFTHMFKVDPQIRPEIVAGVPFLALAVPIATLTGVLTGALQGREQFLKTNSVSVTSTILFQLFPLAVAWFLGPDLPRLLVAALAARLVAVVALWVLAHAELTRGHPVRVERARLNELLRFGGWVSVTSFFGPVLIVTDRFFIGATIGAVAVTIYTIPLQLAQRITVLPASLTSALFPRLSFAPTEEKRRLGRKALRALMALMTAPILVAMLAIGPFLAFWIGQEIGAQAAPLGRIMLVGIWVNSLALVSLTRLQAIGKPDIVAKIHMLEVVPYIIGLIIALKHFGIVGAAWIFTVRCLCDFLALSWLVDKKIQDVWLLSANMVLLIFVASLHLLILSPFVMAMSVGLSIAISGVLGWVSMPDDMRGLAKGMLRRQTVDTKAD